MIAHKAPVPAWFVKGDLDGFFGLMIDNLMQLIVIGALCQHVCGLAPARIFGVILPGAAVSIIIGNLFYAWQARRLAKRQNRHDVTALPYGINTVSMFAFIFFVMLPVKEQTGSSEIAWKVGLLACFGSGLIEIAGAFVAGAIRKHTPRAALLSALAGIAMTFVAMDFAMRIFTHPLVALLPLAIILLEYFGRIHFPLGLPGGMVALAVGTCLAWGLNLVGIGFMSPEGVRRSLHEFQVTLPSFCGAALWDILKSGYVWKYLSVIFPMGIINVIGSLQNIESAEAAGDSYKTMPSLACNGIGSIAAALFGSCFPTTIYIGHPGWKALGARSGYSSINALFISLICFSGLVNLIFNIVPLEAGAPIVLWIGIIITAQAFQTTPREHAPAVAFGIFPSVAAYAVMVIGTTLTAAGTGWSTLGLNAFVASDLHIYGMIALERGFLLNSMILSSMAVFVIQKEFARAALWAAIAAVLSFTGVIHAFRITSGGIEGLYGFNVAPAFSAAYGIMACVFGLAACSRRNRKA